MKDLIIAPTENTPGVDCSFGIIAFTGCSISDDAKTLFDSTHSWVKKYMKNPAMETVVSVKFEYIDASSAQSLFSIFKQLKALESKGFILLINWHYEYGDIEMVELGEVIQGRLEMDFDFIEIQNPGS